MTLVITSRGGRRPAKITKIEWERSRFRSHSIAVEDRDLDIDLDDRNSTSGVLIVLVCSYLLCIFVVLSTVESLYVLYSVSLTSLK